MPPSQQKEIKRGHLITEMRNEYIYCLLAFAVECVVLDRGYEFYLLCHYLNKQLFQKQLCIFI